MSMSKTRQNQVKRTNGRSKVETPAPDPAPPEGALSGEEEITAQTALARFLPEALALPADKIGLYRTDPALALHNVRLGVASVLPYRAVIEAELPAVPMAAITTLPELALALRYAAIQADQKVPRRRVVLEGVREMLPLRRKLLAIAEGLAQAGLVPQREVDAIRAGRGWADGARDLIRLDDLFVKHAAAITGKHAATAEMLRDAQRVGTFLLVNLKPRHGRAARTSIDGPSAAVDARNRLNALLPMKFALLRKVGCYLFGDGYDAKVPPLQSRLLGARSVKGAGEPGAPVERSSPA
jgi:hypothetical protein